MDDETILHVVLALKLLLLAATVLVWYLIQDVEEGRVLVPLFDLLHVRIAHAI
jgi:hypothetical protein